MTTHLFPFGDGAQQFILQLKVQITTTKLCLSYGVTRALQIIIDAYLSAVVMVSIFSRVACCGHHVVLLFYRCCSIAVAINVMLHATTVSDVFELCRASESILISSIRGGRERIGRVVMLVGTDGTKPAYLRICFPLSVFQRGDSPPLAPQGLLLR